MGRLLFIDVIDAVTFQQNPNLDLQVKNSTIQEANSLVLVNSEVSINYAYILTIMRFIYYYLTLLSVNDMTLFAIIVVVIIIIK